MRNAVSVYRERRRRFLDAIGEGAIAVLQGADLATRSRDTNYPFRQDNDFLYLTGFNHPNAIALLRSDGGPAFTLYVEPKRKEQETWTGIRPGVDGAKNEYGADEAYPIDDFRKALPGLISEADRLYHVLGRNAEMDRILVETLESARLRSRSHKDPLATIIDPRSLLHEMRLFKEEPEIEIMRRAAAITTEAHREAGRLAKAGTPEYVLAATLDYVFRRNGANGPAYETIVGSGKNATILHYIENNDQLRKGDLVLIDAGCELEGYASDVTRTYPIDGSFRGAKGAVYAIVQAAEQAALTSCQPGTTLPDIHRSALREIVRGLVDLRILKGNIDGLIESEAYKPYYMHNTSHWLGLDVHDVGAYNVGGKPRPLAEGMVFTVEPGLYLAADDDSIPPPLRGIGVRIEDNVLITHDGRENLTAAIPTRPSEVEAWVRGG